MKIHGQIDNHQGRWCAICNTYHGQHYICKYYSKNLKKEIREDRNKFINDLQNPEWIEKQLKNNISREAILIYKALLL